MTLFTSVCPNTTKLLYLYRMKTKFNVEVLKFSTIQELPGAWSNEDYKALLEVTEFGDTSEIPENELKEMALMAITDNEPDEAAKIILEYIFKDRLTDGQKDNLSHEMIDEKIWEEYADLSMHEEFFNAGQFLYKAYNGKFPNPDAVQFQVKVIGKNSHDLELFDQDTEATLLRLLVNGMPDNTLIKRLFNEKIEGEDFDEAKDIIWQLKKIDSDTTSVTFEAISSNYWFHDLKFVESFEGETRVDTLEE